MTARDHPRKIEAIVDTLNEAVIVLDRDCRVTFANREARRMLGLSAGDVAQQACTRESMLGAVWETGNPVQGAELILEEKGETKVFVSSHAAPLREQDGSIAAVVATFGGLPQGKTLLSSEEKFQAITHAAKDAIIMIDDQERVAYWNQAAEDIFGFTRDEALGTELHTLIVPPRFSKLHLRGFSRFKNTGEGRVIGKTLELAALRKGGDEFPIELSLSAIEIGGKWSAIGVVRDITERKDAQEALRRANEELEAAVESRTTELSLMNHALKDEIAHRKETEHSLLREKGRLEDITVNANCGLFLLDAQTRVTYANRLAQEWFGPFEQLEGKFCWEAFKLTDPARQCAALKVVRTHATQSGDAFVSLTGGTERYFYVVATPIKNADGEIEQITEVVVDVTKQKRAETELREAEERYRALVEMSPDAIIVHSGGRIIFANGSALRLTGAKNAGELIGRAVLDFVHPDFHDAVRERLARLADGSIAPPMEEKLLRLDGSVVDAEVAATPLMYQGVRATQVVVRDISERRRAASLSAALNRINSTINSTLDVDQVMQTVLREAADLLGAESAAMNTRGKDFWVTKYVYGLELASVGKRIPYEAAPVLRLADESQQAVVVNDAENDYRFDPEPLKACGIRSMLVVPLIVRGRVTSAISFHNHTAPLPFDGIEVDFAKKLAAAVSLAQENARYYTDEQTARQLSDSLNDLNALLHSSRDFDELMRWVAEGASKALGSAEKIEITLRDGGCWTFSGLHGLQYVPEDTRPTDLSMAVGTLVRSTRQSIMITDAQKDELIDGRLAERIGVSSILASPLFERNEVVGSLSASSPTIGAFTASHLDFMRKLAASTSLAIENARSFAAEHRIAETLQKVALTVPEHIPGVDFGFLYKSATATAEVGGDFFDIFEFPSGKVAILIGDVSGKGLEAATLTSLVKNTLRAYALEHDSPADVMTRGNDLLKRTVSETVFVTVFLGVLDPESGDLTYCSAGHPPAIVKSARSVRTLETTSPIIGAFDGMHYQDINDSLGPGDVLITYTDGVIEAKRDGELFGEVGLLEFLQDQAPVPAREVPDAVFNHLMEYTRGILSDDTALLCVELERSKMIRGSKRSHRSKAPK